MDAEEMFNSVLGELKTAIEGQTKARTERDETKTKLYGTERELKAAKERIAQLERRNEIYEPQEEHPAVHPATNVASFSDPNNPPF